MGFLGNSGRVQPQSALALVMTSGALPRFVNSELSRDNSLVIGNYAEVMGFSDECYECVPLCVLFLFASAGAMASSASRVTRIIFFITLTFMILPESPPIVRIRVCFLSWKSIYLQN